MAVANAIEALKKERIDVNVFSFIIRQKPKSKMKAILLLEDGTVFEGDQLRGQRPEVRGSGLHTV